MSYEIIDSAENYRKVKIQDKVIELNREDPYGFWYFKWPTGNPPAELAGAFTHNTSAIEFLENYLLRIDASPKRKTSAVKE